MAGVMLQQGAPGQLELDGNNHKRGLAYGQPRVVGVYAGHLVTASILSAPAALAISKVMYPETEESQTAGQLKMDIPRSSGNVVEAAARSGSLITAGHRS